MFYLHVRLKVLELFCEEGFLNIFLFKKTPKHECRLSLKLERVTIDFLVYEYGLGHIKSISNKELENLRHFIDDRNP